MGARSLRARAVCRLILSLNFTPLLRFAVEHPHLLPPYLMTEENLLCSARFLCWRRERACVSLI